MLIYSDNSLDGRMYKRLKRWVQMNPGKTQPNLVIRLSCACHISDMVSMATGLIV